MRLSHVKGLEALKFSLNELTPALARKVVSKANRKGAQALRDKARSLAPIDTGALRDAIVSGAGRSNRKLVYTQLVGISDQKWIGRSPRDLPPSSYANIVEHGHTAPDGTQVPPDPFMRDAFDRSGDFVVQTIVNVMSDGIHEEAAKLGRNAP